MGGFVAQPQTGGNPMTNFLQSLENLTGSQGQALVGTGTKTTQNAMPMIGTGQQTTAGGIEALAPSLDFLTRLVKGDQADVQQAEAPQDHALTEQFAAIRNMISSQPRGGGKASALAELPFKKAETETTNATNARTGAASTLGNIATSLAGIGVQQSGVGLGLANLGLSESALGLSGEEASANEGLTQREQNIQERAAIDAMIGNIAKGVGSFVGGGLVSGLFSGLGGSGGGSGSGDYGGET